MSSPTAPTTEPVLPNGPEPHHDRPVYNEMMWYAELQAQDDSSDDSITPRFVCPRSSLSKFICCFQAGLHNQLAKIQSCGAFEILNYKMALQ